MGHQALFRGDRLEQHGIDFNRVEGRQTQARQVRDQIQDLAHEPPERRMARQIAAIGRDVDAREDDFLGAVFDEVADLLDDGARRDRP